MGQINSVGQARHLHEPILVIRLASLQEERQCTVPSHVLFPQLAGIVNRYVEDRVLAQPPADKKDLFLAPCYGWLVERLLEAIRPDTSLGEAPEMPRYEANREPASTAEVDFWTSRDVRDVTHSHLNYVVADTERWEQSAAYYIDKHPAVAAFVKNSGLGFAIPYLHNGQMHDSADYRSSLILALPRSLTSLGLTVNGPKQV
jgi:type III restriction enzyme